jgi:hypothetical protein
MARADPAAGFVAKKELEATTGKACGDRRELRQSDVM